MVVTRTHDVHVEGQTPEPIGNSILTETATIPNILNKNQITLSISFYFRSMYHADINVFFLVSKEIHTVKTKQKSL
jgi:hypothetical protein